MAHTLAFSIVIPVYNRPNEIDELLLSLKQQLYEDKFEVIVVDDGSKPELSCKSVVEKYKPELDILYFYKSNSGAGLSRNYGMTKATGNYFIILDSDVILPKTYLNTVYDKLTQNYTDIYGGPDAAHKDFTNLQKAINYAMTSFFTTGGLRGGKNNKDYQPRSYNLGLSKEVFTATKGFSSRKIGEDIDFSFRVKKLNYTSQLIYEAFVYHKRRNTLKQFFKQTFAFGKERPKLNKQYPNTSKPTYWLPSLFVLGLLFSLITLSFHCFLPIIIYVTYLIAILIDASVKNKSIVVGFTAILTTTTQFMGYGLGFLKGLIS